MNEKIINNQYQEEYPRIKKENNILFRKNKCLEEEIFLLKQELEKTLKNVNNDLKKEINQLNEKNKILSNNLTIKNNEIISLQKQNLLYKEKINILEK